MSWRNMDNGFAPPEEWPELMTKAQAGDRHAYTQLLRAIVPAIRTIARRQVSDSVLVEDVVQDVLLTVHRVRHTYDPGCPFLPWLMAITQARAIDALRHRGRNQRRETDAEEALSAIAVEDSSEHQDIQEQLTQILEQIHLQEMTLAQAASRHNLTISAVKSLLHRAITNLRRMGANHDQS
ncbi:RNA polymerase sigma factor CarQ [compost metagenome]